MKTTFLVPRFAGPRFEEATLPLNLGRDLAAYEELVIEVAKHLYRSEHPDRVRVPKGFEKNFSLHFEGVVEAGSAKPMLSWVLAAGLAFADVETGYFTRARDLVADAVRAQTAGAALPAKIPKHLLGYFNTFGRSLQDGESVDICPPGTPSAVLTPERRKQLVLAAQKEYKKDVEIRGTIEEADYAKETFRLRSSEGGAVVVSMPKSFGEAVRKAVGRTRMQVSIKGVGTFDARDVQQEAVKLEHLELLPNQELADEFEKLAELKAGWLDGDGAAPDPAHLEWIAVRLASKFPEEVPFPYVAALPDGGVFLEWISDAVRISAEFENGSRTAKLHTVRIADGQSHVLAVDLDTDGGLTSFFNFVLSAI